MNKTKTASVLLSFFMMGLVMSCDNKKEEATPAPATPAATTPAATTPAPATTTPAATTPAATTPAAKPGMDTGGTKGKPVVTGDAPAPAAH